MVGKQFGGIISSWINVMELPESIRDKMGFANTTELMDVTTMDVQGTQSTDESDTFDSKDSGWH